ncbi:MAG: beta-propeller fold lactonase family protein [Anaerolineae bacterium]|nr:beta-propeller fold lactonase family protein [Anaerolineae bacterium]
MRRLIILIILTLCAVAADLLPEDSTATSALNTTTSPKLASSALAITADGQWVIAVNPDSNSVTMLDTTTHAVTEIPVGIDPRAVTVETHPAASRAYIANQGSDSVSVLDLTTRTITNEIAVGDRPVGVVLSPDGTQLYVAELGDDSVRVIDTATLTTHEIFTVADRPYGLAITPDGTRLLVTHLLSGEVTLITRPPDAAANHVITATIATWANVAPAPTVITNHSGTRAYLPQTMAHGLGLNTQFDNSVFAKVSVLNLDDCTHQTAEHISLPETDQPVGLPWDAALALNDTQLWVLNAGSNDLSVVDISTPNRPVRTAHLTVGDNPRGIVLSPDGTRAYVNNTLAGTISVIDMQAYTVLEDIPITTLPLPPLLLRGKQLFYSSARADLAQAAWISCNTCHIEGEHDGRTWQLQYIGDVPEGATPVIVRNTTSLLGMIETYPLRWSGEWDESADSEFSVRFEQYGSGLIHGEEMHPTLGEPNQGRSYDLDALGAYIDSLAVPARAQPLSPAEERGRLIFESPETECANCHPAPLYTNLRAYDVGTARGPGEWFGPEIDTPTLRFLYDSAPYLHNGSAPTLHDVLTTANPADEHGVTSHLSDQELDNLIAFLLALPYEP